MTPFLSVSVTADPSGLLTTWFSGSLPQRSMAVLHDNKSVLFCQHSVPFTSGKSTLTPVSSTGQTYPPPFEGEEFPSWLQNFMTSAKLLILVRLVLSTKPS